MAELIVVVDDDKAFRSIVKILLERRGYEVKTAPNVRSALSILDSVIPSLFILDVMLPDGNGIDLCRELRRRTNTRYTPVMIFSSNDDRSTIQRSMDAGATQFLCKSQLSSRLVYGVQELLTRVATRAV
ncbi:MAG: two component transcriptional regulator [Chloroflexi bacterium OLB15]|nr:MAG: two component transcriptional regulator [Chloroflexi bacterium OLB15]